MNLTDPTSSIFEDIIIDNCGVGISNSVSTPIGIHLFFRNINFTNNTTDTTNIPEILNKTTAAPEFVDAANGDFETGDNMNVTYAWPGGLTSTTVKLGAVQKSGGAAGGGVTGYIG